MAVGVVVPAAGRGSRLGNSENKIWLRIDGWPLIAWVLHAFQSHPRIDHIVLVGAAHELDRLRIQTAGFSKVAAIVTGGPTRAESVGNGLAALPPDCEFVLVHDAARPAISAELIGAVLDEVQASGAALPGLPVTDTLKRVDGENRVTETVSRESLWSVQTPQGARLDHLRAAYEKLGPRIADMTDEAAILEAAGFPVTIVLGEEANIKVTRPGDLERAAQSLTKRRAGGTGESMFPEIRTGFGYDVHQFADNRPLWMGGVQIPHNRGLAGHSDADVLLHAVCDALLGAAGMGDIGVLFPDTDSAHKDRASIEFVREVRRRLDVEGWQIANVDVALLAEEPRIGPFRAQIVAVIADGLSIAPTQVNIKATTSEKMGFVGRREGIACWALATIHRTGER
jgi:2-C-methyl-D-erythritol 4-phosphate cytidylyltransferase/2-C-methyl-D-erythritol 2,4-cyclodiphosphate synthase